MFFNKEKRKREKLINGAQNIMRTMYREGVSINEIAQMFSIEVEYANIVVLSKNNKCVPDYLEWKFNYFHILYENNIDMETIEKLSPVNEDYYDNKSLAWEVLNINNYDNFDDWLKDRMEVQ